MGREGLDQRSRLPSIASLIKKKAPSTAAGAKQQHAAHGSSDSGSAGGSQPLKRLSSSSYSKGVMHQRAANKFVQLSTSYKSRKELQEQEQVELPRWVVHPHDILAQSWWTFILFTVVVTLFVEPYSLAFAAFPGLHPLDSPDTILAIIITTVYATDVLLNFFVAYYDEGELVTSLSKIARHYARRRLWLDLVTTIPFDWIFLEALGLQTSNSELAWYISLLRLLRLGRAYRLFGWVTFLTYNQTVSLVVVTLVRNFMICFFVVHWAACGFYYIAKQGGFAATSWVGAAGDWIGGATTIELYIYSMYWSVITFATVGYGDFHAYSVPEALFTIFYVFINIGVAAYIIGTITLLVVKGDEKTGAYRERLSVLDAYSATHEIPETLKADMKGHLRLHFSSAEGSDEAVLSVYPTTIRRRILRHLYSNPLSRCWLFGNCKQKFLDAVLASAKVELYMPKVDIISEGDHVNEVYIIVAGQAIAERGNSMATTGHPEGVLLADDGATSVHGGSTRCFGPGDTAGEMAFFTETPCTESVRTTSLCRVLVIPRTVYNALAADFPISTGAVMDNLVARAEQMVEQEFPGPSADRVIAELGAMGSLEHKHASAELASASVASIGSNGSGRLPIPAAPPVPLMVDPMGLPLRTSQQQVIANLLRVRGLVQQTRARHEQQRTNEFLSACSASDSDRIRVMLQQGCDVNCCDYDGRTGLMLAASKGNPTTVKILLMAGASINASDNMGGSALLEACKGGHDETIQLLKEHNGTLTLGGVTTAAYLCTAVFDGDLQLLRRLISAGANVNAFDYDRRTATHIAAADGNLSMVKLLVEEGGANPTVMDRWEQTPLDEARRVGAQPVVEYLTARVPSTCAKDAGVKFQVWQAQAMLNAASRADINTLQRLLERGCSADVCDYDKRTALMLAAANGHEAVVSLLLAAGANPCARDNFGSNAVLEAVNNGQSVVLEQLLAAGASLPLSKTELATKLCSLVMEGKMQLLQSYVMAGANANVGDYDKRTPLHIAAAEGNLQMVKLLVEHAHADAHMKDRWGATPMDEAKRVGCATVVAYLKA